MESTTSNNEQPTGVSPRTHTIELGNNDTEKTIEDINDDNPT